MQCRWHCIIVIVEYNMCTIMVVVSETKYSSDWLDNNVLSQPRTTKLFCNSHRCGSSIIVAVNVTLHMLTYQIIRVLWTGTPSCQNDVAYYHQNCLQGMIQGLYL